MNYDFSQLNDKEFEALASDLLSALLNQRIERFKPGKDKGVDGRYFSDSRKEIIIQCKHYIKSGYSALISKLKKDEVDKVKRLKIEKYLFATSLPLSRENKNEIKEIFSPYIDNESDIFGNEDLNDLLSKNPQIEEKYFKLWLASTTVFNRLINNAIKGRSEAEITRILSKSYRYVPTANHYVALDILKNNNVVIISGEPGIGKTSLAENLCSYYAAKNFEFFSIEESLSEAENVVIYGKKQVFYFDDFLGSNYFEAIENKKDSHIVKFIDRVQRDKSKIFILTSRTNILNLGIQHSSVLANSKIQKNELVLTIEKIGELDKAKILYSHIWFSKLNEEFINEIYKDRRYKAIISHKNFNPRLVDFITDIDRVNVAPQDYWGYINEMLANPKEIWANSFKVQSNSYVRSLVALTVFNGQAISEEDLEISFYRFSEFEGVTNPSHTEKDFSSTAQMAIKSFLNRARLDNKVSYSLFNPSIADYVINEYKNNMKKLTFLFQSLGTVESLERLLSLSKNKIVSIESYDKILQAIFIDIFTNAKSYDYQICICFLFGGDESKKESILGKIKEILAKPHPISEFYKFFTLILEQRNNIPNISAKTISELISECSMDMDDISALAELLYIYKIDDENIFEDISEELEENILGRLDDIINEIKLDSYIFCYGPDDVFIDESAVREKIASDIENLLSDYGINKLEKIQLDIDLIVQNVDVEEMLNDHNNANDDWDGFSYPKEWDASFEQGNQIDDLFERT